MISPVRSSSPECHPSPWKSCGALTGYFSAPDFKSPYQQNGDDKNTYHMRLLCEFYKKQDTLITWHRTWYIIRVQQTAAHYYN